MRNILVPLALVASLSVAALAQAPRQPAPEFFKSTDGQELFKFYCANCHGMDAKGRAATPAMRTPSPDLTMLSAANGGVFPHDRVAAVITHGSTASPAHGPKNMPVWGAIFRSMETNDTLVEIRIENLVRYLESLQVSSSRLGAK
jgi:mono/diheme cytochrome c family protein